ncbi:hypothetical protein NIES2104_25250 [Leptolyngbya sp. NIES-2104]|nr:hypothetical protein NIES2104_25250 [Leptolyngbya sp. NIES-2104]
MAYRSFPDVNSCEFALVEQVVDGYRKAASLSTANWHCM